MNQEEKAAILLLSLDEDVAAKVIKNLRPEEVELLSRNMSRINAVSLNEVNAVAREFCELARSKGGILSVTDDFTKNIFVKALGEERAQSYLSIMEKEGRAAVYNPIIEKLKDIDPQMLTDFTKTEHPQTIALILAHLDPQQAAEVLESFSVEMQCEVAKRMATLKSVPSELIEEIARTLEKEIMVGRVSGKKAGGAAMMAEILNRMSRASESAIMQALDEAFPGIATEIRSQMFTFDDVLKLDDRSMQELLREVSSEDLSRALKIVDEEARERVFRNMSKRGAEMLKEDIELMPPTRLSEIEKSQMVIIETTKRLEAEGKIFLARGEEEDKLV
ncbi:MAG: flagellar motor switch protein FliG [Syntrophales bacterium]